eukprot:3188131-Rhodomonas_salina.1
MEGQKEGGAREPAPKRRRRVIEPPTRSRGSLAGWLLSDEDVNVWALRLPVLVRTAGRVRLMEGRLEVKKRVPCGRSHNLKQPLREAAASASA